MNPGGLPKNSKKVNERGCMQRFMIERSNPLTTDLWVKPQMKGFHEFILFVADRSFTADGGLLLPTGGCKDNTSKDPFSQCEQLQGIHIQVKSRYMGTLTMTEMMTRMRRTSTTTCLTWTQT